MCKLLKGLLSSFVSFFSPMCSLIYFLSRWLEATGLNFFFFCCVCICVKVEVRSLFAKSTSTTPLSSFCWLCNSTRNGPPNTHKELYRYNIFFLDDLKDFPQHKLLSKWLLMFKDEFLLLFYFLNFLCLNIPSQKKYLDFYRLSHNAGFVRCCKS